MAGDSFKHRFWEAYKDLEKREGKVSQTILAKRIQDAGGHRTRQDDISRWIKGPGKPDTEELPAIAQVLGVDLMELAFGSEPAGKGAGGLLGAPLTRDEKLVRPEDVARKKSRRRQA